MTFILEMMHCVLNEISCTGKEKTEPFVQHFDYYFRWSRVLQDSLTFDKKPMPPCPTSNWVQPRPINETLIWKHRPLLAIDLDKVPLEDESSLPIIHDSSVSILGIHGPRHPVHNLTFNPNLDILVSNGTISMASDSSSFFWHDNISIRSNALATRCRQKHHPNHKGKETKPTFKKPVAHMIFCFVITVQILQVIIYF